MRPIVAERLERASRYSHNGSLTIVVKKHNWRCRTFVLGLIVLRMGKGKRVAQRNASKSREADKDVSRVGNKAEKCVARPDKRETRRTVCENQNI